MYELVSKIASNGFGACAGRVSNCRQLLKCSEVHREVKIF